MAAGLSLVLRGLFAARYRDGRRTSVLHGTTAHVWPRLVPGAWYFAQVEPDGDACFCGDFPDHVIGNVRRQPFPAIWSGKKRRPSPST